MDLMFNLVAGLKIVWNSEECIQTDLVDPLTLVGTTGMMPHAVAVESSYVNFSVSDGQKHQ